MDGTIGILVGVTGATTVTSYLVALFKMAQPAASSALIVLVAILVGQLCAVAVTAAGEGLSFTQKGVSTVFIMGILATAAAAGVSKTDKSAEEKRIGPDVQAQREIAAELGAKAEKAAK